MLPQGKTPMGGDGGRSGKNVKGYVEPMGEAKKDDSYLETDMKKRQANNEKARKDLMKGPQMKNPHFEETEVQEGHCEEEGVKCSPTEKKKDSKKMKEDVYHSWREGFEFLDEIAQVVVHTLVSIMRTTSRTPKAKTDDRSQVRRS